MKKLVLSATLAFAISATSMVASSALATPVNDYFTANAIIFQNQRENAAYEIDIGLYSMDNPTEKFQVFSYLDEPSFFATRMVTAMDWSPLADGFGFYADIHTGGANDPTVDYHWTTDQTLNSLPDGTLVDTDIEHIVVSDISPFGLFHVYVDDQLGGGDRDFNDQVIGGFSCSMEPTAPVPEPATMFLFGTGLAGLAGFRRRKS